MNLSSMFHDHLIQESERTVTLSRNDLSAARRVLRVLLGVDRKVAEALENCAPTRTAMGGDRAVLVAYAREAFANRRRRGSIFGQSMFGEAAWDMLLALYVMEMSGPRQTVGDLMKLAGTPITTANRWLAFLVARGLVQRQDHPNDRRSSFVSLTDSARTKMDEYFSGTVRTQV